MLARAIIPVLAVALLTAGCGEPAVSTFQTAPAMAATAADLQFSCDGVDDPFTAALFDGVGNAESLDNAIGKALRFFLAHPPPDLHFPAHGWFLVGADSNIATFVAPDVGGPGLLTVGVANQPAGWEASGGSCRAEVVLDGLNHADWILEPQAAPPRATDSQFIALVTEQECASGQSSATRLVSPTIFYEKDRILVIFAVRRPEGQAQTCQGNPASRVLVQLHEPIGDRKLLDGGRYPPREPHEPAV